MGCNDDWKREVVIKTGGGKEETVVLVCCRRSCFSQTLDLEISEGKITLKNKRRKM